jgi:hypothetical protein
VVIGCTRHNSRKVMIMKETNVFHAALKRYTLLTYLLTYPLTNILHQYSCYVTCVGLLVNSVGSRELGQESTWKIKIRVAG